MLARVRHRLGFCGIGQIGLPIARHLLADGNHLVVWNRTRSKTEDLASQGASVVMTPAETAVDADAVITSLATPAALEEVLFGADGVVHALRAGTTLIDMSTVSPDMARSIAARVPAGVEVVDAPVLGTVPHAEARSLKVFFGGSEEAFARWSPLLDVLGSTRYIGPLGSGASMKLVANSVLVALLSVLGEALALADGLGLDRGLVLDTLEESPLGPTVGAKRKMIEGGAYAPDCKLWIGHKDSRLVLDAARDAGIELRLARAAEQWMAEAEQSGLADLDVAAVVARITARA
jgi:3-hydroxyisobutyrate dehydrogenase-like beta-hydroxyacid dehydrogenase